MGDETYKGRVIEERNDLKVKVDKLISFSSLGREVDLRAWCFVHLATISV